MGAISMKNGQRALAVGAALAACAAVVPAPVLADDGKCEWGLLVAHSAPVTGRIPEPARLALQRDAGADTIGVADIALLTDRQCAAERGHSYLDFGLEYHLDTDPDAPTERVSGSIAYTRTWSPLTRDDTHPYQKLQFFGEFGRDIEAGRSAAHLGASYVRFPTTSGGKFRRGPLGGEIDRKNSEDVTPLLRYEVSPQVDYFVGYQPKDVEDRLDAAYAGATAKAEWVPFSSSRGGLHGFYASVKWTGQRRLWGDEPLPRSYTWTTASVGYRFEQPEETRKSFVAIALDYEKGRSPDDGFVRSEGFVLALKYSLAIER
jgi:hypothetical protein